MTILEKVQKQLPEKIFDKVGLFLIWGLSLLSLFGDIRSNLIGQHYGLFSLCFIPMLFVFIRDFEIKRFGFGCLATCLLSLLSLSVFRDPYFIQPFWGFYIETTLIASSFVFGLTYVTEQKNDERFKFIIEACFSILLLFGFEKIFDGLLSNIEEYNWEKIRVAVWATGYLLIQELNLNTLIQDLYKKFQSPSFVTKFTFVSFSLVWAFSAYKLGGSYQKTYFYFSILLLGTWLPRIAKFYLIILLFAMNMHTGWQVIHMNYEVTYSFLFLLGIMIICFLISQELKALFHKAVAPLTVMILALGFGTRFHLYHLNLKSTKSLLVEVATRMEMYQEGKIQPIQKEISNDAKKRFGTILFTLIKYHPVESFQDIFGPNLKTIFQHSRPMYSDETYNKFKSRLDSVMSRLNINWRVQARLQQSGQMVTISSIDHNSHVTKLKNEDFVSKNLNFKFKLKDGRKLATKAEPRLGQVLIFLDDKVVKTVSFDEIVYQHVPAEFSERQLQLHLQPDQLERVVEVQGIRIRIKISRIFGRKEAERFNFSQLNGQIFLKTNQ
jgi:hypothetical protein